MFATNPTDPEPLRITLLALFKEILATAHFTGNVPLALKAQAYINELEWFDLSYIFG